jgi:hypothetical protein
MKYYFLYDALFMIAAWLAIALLFLVTYIIL